MSEPIQLSPDEERAYLAFEKTEQELRNKLYAAREAAKKAIQEKNRIERAIKLVQKQRRPLAAKKFPSLYPEMQPKTIPSP